MTATTGTRELQSKMAALIAKTKTTILCNALLLMETRELGNIERMVQGQITDELCRRVPAADTAAERWTFDPAMWESDISLTEVVVSAALATTV